MIIEIWQIIVGAIATIATGGGLSYLFFYKPKKVGENADAADKAGGALSDWLVIFREQQVLLRTALTENEAARRTVVLLELRVSELERQISGLQRAMDKEVKLRKFSESNVCLLTECSLRKPALGTYTSNNALDQ